LSNPVNRQTDKHTDTGENITSLAQVKIKKHDLIQNSVKTGIETSYKGEQRVFVMWYRFTWPIFAHFVSHYIDFNNNVLLGRLINNNMYAIPVPILF